MTMDNCNTALIKNRRHKAADSIILGGVSSQRKHERSIQSNKVHDCEAMQILDAGRSSSFIQFNPSILCLDIFDSEVSLSKSLKRFGICTLRHENEWALVTIAEAINVDSIQEDVYSYLHKCRSISENGENEKSNPSEIICDKLERRLDDLVSRSSREATGEEPMSPHIKENSIFPLEPSTLDCETRCDRLWSETECERKRDKSLEPAFTECKGISRIICRKKKRKSRHIFVNSGSPEKEKHRTRTSETCAAFVGKLKTLNNKPPCKNPHLTWSSLKNGIRWRKAIVFKSILLRSSCNKRSQKLIESRNDDTVLMSDSTRSENDCVMLNCLRRKKSNVKVVRKTHTSLHTD